MNRQLFNDALSSIIITSDFVEFLESGRSFIVDALVERNYSQEYAEAFLLDAGIENTTRAEQLMERIQSLGMEEEFEYWSDQDENFVARKDGIIQAIEIGTRFNMAPKH